MDNARSLGVKFLWLIAGGVIFQLAWQGNLGKGLACVIAPGALEVTVNQSGVSTSTANAGTNNGSIQPT